MFERDLVTNPDYDQYSGNVGQAIDDQQRTLQQLEADSSTDAGFDNTGHNVTLGTSGGRTFADFTGTATLSQISDAGTMADKDVAGAVADLSLTVSAGYVQAEVQSIVDKLNALLGSLRTATHIS